MAKEIVELPVEDLKLGLYVSRLDRPWEDTPFLFQGFEVDNDEDLKALRRLCKVVYVEVSIAEAEELKAAKRNGSAPRRKGPQEDALELLSVDPSALLNRVPAKDPVPLKAELAAATATFSEARVAVGAIFDRLRRGSGLDVPHLQTVVGSMVDSVLRNRDAMGWLAQMKSKDDYLYSHSLSSSVWALAFGRYLGLDKDTLTSLGTGAMLLDIGKTSSANRTAQEIQQAQYAGMDLLHTHVARGVELMRAAPKVDPRIIP